MLSLTSKYLGSYVREKAISEFPRPPPLVPLYQNEVKCSTFDMERIFHSHANKSHFHNKGFALGLILIVRVFGTRKWPVAGPVGKNVKFQVLFVLVITERGTS